MWTGHINYGNRLVRVMHVQAVFARMLSLLQAVSPQPSVWLNTWSAKWCAEFVFSMHVYALIAYLLQPYSQCFCCVCVHIVSISIQAPALVNSVVWLVRNMASFTDRCHVLWILLCPQLFTYAMTIAVLWSVYTGCLSYSWTDSSNEYYEILKGLRPLDTAVLSLCVNALP